MSLEGQVAVITGGSKGVGRAVALRFAKLGLKQVIGARGVSDLEKVVQEIRDVGGEAVGVPTDVSDPADAKNLVTSAMDEYGNLDILINNAGVGIYGDIEKFYLTDLDTLLSINLKGTYYCSQAAFRIMKQQKSGHVINVASIAGKMGLPQESAYNASKFGMVGVGQSLKKEGMPYGIRVHNVCPGGIDTPFWDEVPNPPDVSKFLTPDEVAGVVEYVATSSENVVFEDITIHPKQEYEERMI